MIAFYYPATPEIELPAGHRFPREKYQLLRDLLFRDGIIAPSDLVASDPATPDQLLNAHDQAYVDAVLEGTLTREAQRRIGFPWSPSLVNRSTAVVGGAIRSAELALADGVSGQLAGGTHHAHRDFGAGFCVFNDLAVAALTLLATGQVDRIAILDVDVHQGDGNAAILGQEPRAFVASIHSASNYPFRKVPSDLDIALADGADDLSFALALEHALKAIERFRPDLLLYLSGVDGLAADRLGRLSLTHGGLLARDRTVFAFCRRHELPVSIAIGGGYADPISESVRAYANTFRAVREVYG